MNHGIKRLNYVCKKQQFMQVKERIAQAWQNRQLLTDPAFRDAIRNVIEQVDKEP
jgi:hypothetical protein